MTADARIPGKVVCSCLWHCCDCQSGCTSWKHLPGHAHLMLSAQCLPLQLHLNSHRAIKDRRITDGSHSGVRNWLTQIRPDNFCVSMYREQSPWKVLILSCPWLAHSLIHWSTRAAFSAVAPAIKSLLFPFSRRFENLPPWRSTNHEYSAATSALGTAKGRSRFF